MKNYLSLVKFSHTIFALPFALVGYFLGVMRPEHSFDWTILALVLLCMVFARNTAMAFNRWADRDIDGLNPRTAVREIPAGILSADGVLWFTLINAGLFVLTTYFINPLAFYLSPVALLVVMGYSITKRYTALCHLILGMGLALAPIGAYLSVTGSFHIIPVMLGFAVLFWVSGFDIIYALQDDDFDAEHDLNSIPSKFGRSKALWISSMIHVLSAVFILLATYFIHQEYPLTGWMVWAAAGVFISLLIYQHFVVKPNDLSRVNQAFFMANGVASVIFGLLVIFDLTI